MKKKIIVIIVFVILFGLAVLPATSTLINNKSLLLKQQNISLDDQVFDQGIKLLMERGHFPSVSACTIKKESVVWSKGYGFSDKENSITATDNTVYQIASVTKTVTGTALMQLFDLGLFDLDDDVNEYLPFELMNPNFPEDSITFRMLLSHSSSLRDAMTYWEIDFSVEGPPFPGYPSPWLEDYLIPGGKLYDPSVWNDKYPPGEQSAYANINFDLVAYLVELISGEPFYDYCEKYIFEPLDMKNTSFRLTDFDSDQLAIPYFWNPYTKKHERSQNWVFIHYPAGGLFTTVSDLAHFMIAHMNGGVYNETRILEESTVEEMHKVQPPGNKNGFYFGLAWLTMSRSVWIGLEYPSNFIIFFSRALFSGHGGDISYGLHTNMCMKLSENVAVIFFINTHRIHRTGWNCAELLRELLFFKADGLYDGDQIIYPLDLGDITKNDRFNLLSIDVKRNEMFLNNLFMNYFIRKIS